MGNSSSKDGGEAKPKPQSYKEFSVHPLLCAIENPINRFADDFASFLVGGDAANRIELPMNTLGMSEICGYTIKKMLGKGAEAEVYLGQKQGQPPVAIKRYVACQHMDGDMPREVKIAKLLDHPHCMQLLETYQLPDNGDHIVFMPLSTKGELATSNVPVVTAIGAAHFLYQVGAAVAHMHSRNIVHRDIKPGNVLMFDNGYCLIDYSVSVALNGPNDMLSGKVGTSVFMAPEISNNNYAPKPADIWALGITTFVILFGRYPFALDKLLEGGDPMKPISSWIIGYDLVFPETPAIPEELKDIIRGMLRMNPTERMTSEELANHPWIHAKMEEREKLRKYLHGN